MQTTADNSTNETTNRQRWLYSLINLGMTIPYQAVGAVIVFYYTDIKQLPLVWVSTVMTVYAFYNAFNNPIIGFLIDRTKTRWGRRIPYLIFGTIPYALAFAGLFWAPFDGLEQPVSLLVYFCIGLILWEGLGTAVTTGYYSLLPEMFRGYQERTDVAVRMNIVQTVGLIIGTALPFSLADLMGWPVMGVFFAIITAVAIFVGIPGLFERPTTEAEEVPVPLGLAVKATLVNRSFLTVVIAQTLRFFATDTLAVGMAFYMKYSIQSPGDTTIVLGAAFIAAGIALWPWRQWIANRLEARTTLMIAYGFTGVASLTLLLANSLATSILASALVGIGLAGLILMGDVIMADVVDEDQVRMGCRRSGMFFGMSGLITTLASALVSLVMAFLLPMYGYDSTLAAQPATVDMGFRIFMSIPPFIGSLLAILALAFYPLHGKRLAAVKQALSTQVNIPEAVIE